MNETKTELKNNECKDIGKKKREYQKADLINQKFGRLTVISQNPERRNGRVFWNCICECENTGIVTVSTDSLKGGRIKSCGCFFRERAVKSRKGRPNLLNCRFGNLFVISNSDLKSDNYGEFWLCKCDCKNRILVTSRQLNNGSITNCGCIRKSQIRETIEIGRRFGKLKVIEQLLDKNGNPRQKWKCECGCGNFIDMFSTRLLRRKRSSCGECRTHNDNALFKVYSTYKRNADRKGIIFELTEDEFRQLASANCYYCGKTPTRLSKSDGGKNIFYYNGIDRLDSEGGYTRLNGLPCCTDCNKMKLDHSKDYFFTMIKKIYELHHLENFVPQDK